MFQQKFSARQIFSLLVSLAFLVGCNPGSNNNGGYVCSALSDTPSTPTMKNQTPLVVGCGYYNEPCVSVTICVPGSTTQCQTIPDVLLDTGSVGLRLFSCAVTVPIPTETNSVGNTVADFVGYLDGSCDWGPVKNADVYIGTNPFTNPGMTSPEYASSVPVQIIDATFMSVPPTADHPTISCTSPDFSPALVGFNGIMGVGLNKTDCFEGDASNCTASGGTQDGGGTYYACTTTGCTPTGTDTTAQQVTNPVIMMPTDNNGVVLKFPALSGSSPSDGNYSLSGTLTLGVGTQTGSSSFASNSLTYTVSGSPYTATVYETDPDNDFQTNFSGMGGSYSFESNFGFIDSGSNTLAFPVGGSNTLANELPLCGDNPQFYCPSSLIPISATQGGAPNGVPTGPTSPTINMSVANADMLLSAGNPNFVFNDIASQTNSFTYFDWGFPFFIGRTVYVHTGSTTAVSGNNASFWAW